MLSRWLDEAPLAREDEAPALKSDIRADVCIIGGGYCGLWTALTLIQREPSLSIVIVKMNRCGDGANGRNGAAAVYAGHSSKAGVSSRPG